MRIGLIGSGGREHAITKALVNNSPHIFLSIYASYLNPGIQPYAESTSIGDMRDIQKIHDYFVEKKTDLVIVGPEVPLIAGVSDKLRRDGISVVGPTKSQAQLEGDKVFMRDLLKRRVKMGSPRWKEVKDISSARNFINEVGQVAIKPVGLTGGKGVRVMGVHFNSIDEALDNVKHELDQDGILLLEERLIGEEFSRMAFVSNHRIVTMPVAQDFKYAYDGNQGGMTGGMGAYTMANGSMPFLLPEDLEQADVILNATVHAIEEETNQEYRGFLYGQFIATAHGVKVIEFNVRLGDPEAINMMALINTNTIDLFNAIAEGTLAQSNVPFLPQASVCKYLVPADYPDKENERVLIENPEKELEKAGLSTIFASIVQKGSKLETLGSRSYAVVGIGRDTAEISNNIESVLQKIEPPNMRHRKDIGDKTIIKQKVKNLAKIRNNIIQ
jgi:phosphoribosylamine--glycine ligase